MKVYLVILTEGDGDTEIKVVDEETYSWITSTNPGYPADHDQAQSSWQDQLVPESQKLKIIEEHGEEDPAYNFMITSGSWENDRAILCQSADGYGQYCLVKEAIKAITVAGGTFEDEYHGAMY